jgi:hypothetical protein
MPEVNLIIKNQQFAHTKYMLKNIQALLLHVLEVSHHLQGTTPETCLI